MSFEQRTVEVCDACGQEWTETRPLMIALRSIDLTFYYGDPHYTGPPPHDVMLIDPDPENSTRHFCDEDCLVDWIRRQHQEGKFRALGGEH